MNLTPGTVIPTPAGGSNNSVFAPSNGGGSGCGIIENNTDNMRKSGSQYSAISDECLGLAREISWTPAMAPLFVGADTTFAQKVAEFAKEVLARGDFLRSTAEELNTDANSCDRVDQDGQVRYGQDGNKMSTVGDSLGNLGTGDSQAVNLQTTQSQNGTTTNNSVGVATTTPDPQGTPPGSPPVDTVVKREHTPERQERSGIFGGTKTIPATDVVTERFQSSDRNAPAVEIVATTTTTPAHKEPAGLFGTREVPKRVETTYATREAGKA